MAILSKGHTFSNTDSITSSKLNNLVDAATFVSGSSGSTDDTSLEVNGSGRLQVKDLGVSNAKLAANAVTTSKIANSTNATDGVTYAKLQRVGNMKVLGNTSGSLAVASEVSILSEGNMISNSSTALATQASIKTYVDSKPQLGTALAATSNTAFSFTGIPSTAKRITLSFLSLSTNGTSPIIARIGGSVYEISGYVGSAAEIKATPAVVVFTNGFGISPSPAATDFISGIMTICKLSGSYWVASFSAGNSAIAQVYSGGGGIFLGATLDRVQITTSGGTDTFDNGTVNIMYE